ncbi:putative integral membrane protein [Theileria parva strain Muguga]|uniref:Uncharacterized protein n=1 Tax=Theileria parva TaxID=5875 RepID=Q4N371_THEPA|nr:putative integral membrane protein [Theileria parva strain Muguga]EAN31468.1 putative integral membrane protein [Theileria parva strain Muguga]|eukprot:XP_763751.1 hypothetical protein [Theileria parva strain Muguga]
MKRSRGLAYVVSSVLLLLVCGASAGLLVKINFFPPESNTTNTLPNTSNTLPNTSNTHLNGSITGVDVVNPVDLDVSKRSLSNFNYVEDSFGVKFVVKKGFGIRKIYDSSRPHEVIYNNHQEFATQVYLHTDESVRSLMILTNHKALLRHYSTHPFHSHNSHYSHYSHYSHNSHNFNNLTNINNWDMSSLRFYGQSGEELDHSNFSPNLHNLSYGYDFTHGDSENKVVKIVLSGEVLYEYEKMKEFGEVSGVYFNPLKSSFFLLNTENTMRVLTTGTDTTTTISIVNVVEKDKTESLNSELVKRELVLERELVSREWGELLEKGYVAESGSVFSSVSDGERKIWSAEGSDYAVKVLVKVVEAAEMVGIIMLNGTFLLFQRVNKDWENITQRLLYTHLTN